MGVLPLEFKPGTNRLTLGIDGTETFDVIGERTPRADAHAGHPPPQRRARRGAGDLPPRHRRRSVDLRGRRRAAALRAGLPRIAHRRPDRTWQATCMAHTAIRQIKIPATYMRGGTSKGVFFRLQDLPEAAQVPGAARDALLLRVIGSPDPYGKQIDGMGGATSSTSKTVIVSQQHARPTTTSTTCSARSPSTSPSSTGAATAATCRPRSARSRSAAAWSTRRACRATAWHGAHLAGQHRQDHHRPRADDGRRRCRKPATSNSTA